MRTPFWLSPPLLIVPLIIAWSARAEPVDTEIPDVTADVVNLLTSGGVTRLAVRYSNGGSAEAQSDRKSPSAATIGS